MDIRTDVMSAQAEKLPAVTLSLTSYPGRIDRVHITIESLLLQTVPADRVVLWLAREQFPDGEESLPAELLEQKERGLVIEWCDEDIRSYKKIIPSAQKWPEDIIITADDDIIYERNAVERLLASYRRHPDCVSTLRAHLMLFEEDGSPAPYEKWIPEYSAFIDRPLMALFPTTGGGMLFPPRILPEAAFDSAVFTDICPMADDVWIKCMLTLAGVKVVLADVNTRLQYVDGTQGETLYSYNRTGNDAQLAAVLEKYNQIGGEENPEYTLLRRMNDLSDHVPDMDKSQKYRKAISLVNEKMGVKVSVIVYADSPGSHLKRFMRSLCAQTLPDIEMICIDNAAGDETAEILGAAAKQDGRIRIITLPERVSPTQARRRAVSECRGEYCLFPDVRGVLAPDACEQLYAAAEEKDADILSFTCGVIGQQGEAQAVGQGHVGIVRNRNLIFREFEIMNSGDDRLSHCIFGGRLTRRAYLHAMEQPSEGRLYEYFLLCRFSEMYVGCETPVCYALPDEVICDPEGDGSSLEAIERFTAFAHVEEHYAPLLDEFRKRLILSHLEHWCALSGEERGGFLGKILETWGAPLTAAGLVRLSAAKGEELLVRAAMSCTVPQKVFEKQKAGIVVTERSLAREMFNMSEVLELISVNTPVVMLGIGKDAAAGAMIPNRTTCDGEKLRDDEADEFAFGRHLHRLADEHELSCLVLWTGSRRFAQVALQARFSGIAAVAVMTEPFYYSMQSCDRPAAGLSALRLATVTVTDSPAQQRLLDVLGVPARYIPRPALRVMAGRSSARTAENTILWAGCADDSRWRMNDALEVFEKVRRRMSDVRLLIFLDGDEDIEALSERLGEGVTVRRLRPDYGSFGDASVQLVTGMPGLVSAAVRAGRALGVPSVMYRYPFEQESGTGGVLVQEGDTAAAAAEILRLLGSKQLREQLGAQGKVAAGTATREEAARRWTETMTDAAELSGRALRLPEDELGSVLASVMCGYEKGARYNDGLREEHRLRCEGYEQRLDAAEERRVRETEALRADGEKAKEQLRAKERELARTSAQLEEILSSTTYKAGSALTFVPRKLKDQFRKKNDQ